MHIKKKKKKKSFIVDFEIQKKKNHNNQLRTYLKKNFKQNMAIISRIKNNQTCVIKQN